MNIKKSLVFAVNKMHITFVYLAMILLVGITLLTFTNVFMRFFLNSGIFWAEEVTKMLVVWFTYIAMAIGVKQSLHISLHILPENLPPAIERSLNIFKDLIILTIAVVMVIYGYKLIQFTSRSIMPATEWPSSMLYLILPFSGILIAFESIMDLFNIDDYSEKIESLFLLTGEDDGTK
jgi:TRAP-type C4-dicarboxylate transport system permease small subunit